MKKFAIVLAICMLLPLNAFALQPMSEDTMGQVTGQAGVSIAIDDVIIYQNIEYIRYTDVGGTNGIDGAVNISNLYMMVNINAITSLDAAGLPVSPNRAVQGEWDNNAATPAALFNFYNTDAAVWTDADADGVVDTGELAAGQDGINDRFTAKALTIDVGTLAVLTAGAVNNTGIAAATMAGVRIGLPTVEVSQSALTFDVTITAAGALNGGAGPLGNSYGRISIGNMTMGVLDGVVEIAPH